MEKYAHECWKAVLAVRQSMICSAGCLTITYDLVGPRGIYSTFQRSLRDYFQFFNLVPIAMSAKTPLTIAGAIEKFMSKDLNTQLAMRRSYDNWALKQMCSDSKRKRVVNLQKILLSEHQKLGPDVAASRFVVGYCRGQIKNERGNWISRLRDLPDEYSKTFRVIAIQARNAGLLTESIDNFVELDSLESLDLSENPNLDDFACDQLGRQFRRSKKLMEINLSFNPLISVFGLEILFRIPSIRKIIAVETQATTHQEIDLFTLAAEDERQCEVVVHKNGEKFKNPELRNLASETSLVSR